MTMSPSKKLVPSTVSVPGSPGTQLIEPPPATEQLYAAPMRLTVGDVLSIRLLLSNVGGTPVELVHGYAGPGFASAYQPATSIGGFVTFGMVWFCVIAFT